MRTEKEMYNLILDVAKEDERIRSVIMSGSRANPDCLKDIYQDYDIIFTVTDIKPFYNNMSWAFEKFGKPVIVQLPELMTYPFLPPEDDGHFTYLMIFEDGNRIDLNIEFKPYYNNGEPAILLLDKDNIISTLKTNNKYFHIKQPQKEWFFDVCNEFWWCLNNVAKGIARDELPYAMEMFNHSVRDMLNQMIEWYIGINYNFDVSSGKSGKYFKRYLPKHKYEQYIKTYSDSDYKNLLTSIYTACDLFHDCAVQVGEYFSFNYNNQDEISIRAYIKTTTKNINFSL